MSFKLNTTFVILILLIIGIIMVSGCASSSDYKTFDKNGLSLQYPAKWTEISVPANDQQLVNQSGFNITGVFINGTSIQNYSIMMEIAVANITSSNLTAAADNLNNNYIMKEANQAPLVNRTTLKNGYETVIYSYNATGASSNLTILINMYVFTKDNQTAYFVGFATPQNNTNPTQNQQIIQNIMDSVKIQ